MKKYILIISILTILVIFSIIYLSDYIKNIYFKDSIEDFKDVYSIISNSLNKLSYENFENKKDELTTKYEELLELRKSEIFKNSSGEPTMQELSFNAQSEKEKNGVYDVYSSINDPISDEFLPYTIKNYRDDPEAISTNNMNEFTIINIYKNTLDRQPTEKELKKNLQDFYENNIDENILKLRIYNSTEYKIITNMQSNDIKPDLITNISKWQLKDNLKKLYMDQFNTELTNSKLLDILVKCYIHLQFNEYLFKAMLMHDKYKEFEFKLKEEYILSDEKLLEIFNESFILHELRLIANELKRQDVIKRKALSLPVSLNRIEHSELNSSNIVNMGSEKYISDIVKNSDNVFNINIMLNDNKNSSTPYVNTTSYSTDNSRINVNGIDNTLGSELGNILGNGIGGTLANGIGGTLGNGIGGTLANGIGGTLGNGIGNTLGNGIGNTLDNGIGNTLDNGIGNTLGNRVFTSNLDSISTSNLNFGSLSTKKYRDIYSDLYNDINSESKYNETQYSNDEIMNDLKKSQNSSTRIYNPIDYKRHNRGDINSKPNVCLYDKNKIIQPEFSNSSPEFQGTILKDAIENTQVGSIMPKFVFYEYEDIITK